MYQLLIVDDEEDIRRGMARGIPWGDWGFEICGQASNGEEAVAMVERCHPHIVLSDIRMPRMDGVELMRHLHLNNPEIRIIILSGYNDVEYLNMAIKNRVTEYLLKPTDIDEFEAVFGRLKKSLDEETEKRKNLEYLEKSLEQSRELSYNGVLSNLVDGYIRYNPEEAWIRELEERGIDFRHCILYVMDTGKGKEQDDYLLRRQAIQYLNTRETPWPHISFLYRGRQLIGLTTVCGGGPEGETIPLEEWKQFLKEICREILELYGLRFFVGASDLCRDEAAVPDGYQKALERLHHGGEQEMEGEAAKTGNLLVGAIREYLDQEFCSNLLSLEVVAEKFRKNPAYISKVFKKETGFNFSDYITQKRMNHSKELLTNLSLKIYEIAEMTGYADASNFIRVFKKNCGMSPNEYRSFFG